MRVCLQPVTSMGQWSSFRWGSPRSQGDTPLGAVLLQGRGTGVSVGPSRYCLRGNLKKRWCSASRKASSKEMQGLELGVGRAALGPPGRWRGHCLPHCPVLAGLSGPHASIPSCVTVGLGTVSPHMPDSSLNLALSQGPFRWTFSSLAHDWPDSYFSIPCVSVRD